MLLAGLVLFAQILGAALAGASLAGAAQSELCTGAGEPIALPLPEGDQPAGHWHELGPCCLACPSKAPLPPRPTVLSPGPLPRAEPVRPEPDPAPPARERTLRPPGRAPPLAS